MLIIIYVDVSTTSKIDSTRNELAVLKFKTKLLPTVPVQNDKLIY